MRLLIQYFAKNHKKGKEVDMKASEKKKRIFFTVNKRSRFNYENEASKCNCQGQCGGGHCGGGSCSGKCNK